MDRFMKYIAVLALLLLPVAACVPLPLTGPAPVAEATVLDEKAAVGVELAYKGTRLAMELAVDAGLIEGARAATVAELDRKAYAAVLAVRGAYRAGNAATYAATVTEAQGAVSAFLASMKE